MNTTVNATGMLRHMFHGTYHASIVLVFDSEADAVTAASALGAPWRMARGERLAITWIGDSAALDAVKARFAQFELTIKPCGMRRCRKQCADAGIDSVAHSIDYGPHFTIRIPVVPAEQAVLPGVAT